MVQASKGKRTLRIALYKKLLNYTCAHPECQSGMNIEAHHIRPLYKGGVDKFWNIVSLCWVCHRKRKSHSRSEETLLELYAYKSMHELRRVGFVFDEEDDDFKLKISDYIKNNKVITGAEELILNNIDTIREDE